MQEKEPLGFESARARAEAIAEDKEKLEQLVDEAIEKASRYQGALQKIWGDLHTLFRLAHAWRNGQYKQIPWKSIVFALAGIIYFLNPFDIIPDIFPLVGYLDDATIVSFVISSLKEDLEKFNAWEKVR